MSTYLHIPGQRNVAHINGPGVEDWPSIKRHLFNTEYTPMILKLLQSSFKLRLWLHICLYLAAL